LSRVSLSSIAEADLTRIWFEIARDDVAAADRFIDLIHDKCDLLADSPAVGRLRPELAPGVRSFPVRKHVVFYRLVDGDVQVVRVLDGRRDIPALPADG
jgi:toxin ParE1/3/4